MRQPFCYLVHTNAAGAGGGFRTESAGLSGKDCEAVKSWVCNLRPRRHAESRCCAAMALDVAGKLHLCVGTRSSFSIQVAQRGAAELCLAVLTEPIDGRWLETLTLLQAIREVLQRAGGGFEAFEFLISGLNELCAQGLEVKEFDLAALRQLEPGVRREFLRAAFRARVVGGGQPPTELVLQRTKAMRDLAETVALVSGALPYRLRWELRWGCELDAGKELQLKVRWAEKGERPPISREPSDVDVYVDWLERELGSGDLGAVSEVLQDPEIREWEQLLARVMPARPEALVLGAVVERKRVDGEVNKETGGFWRGVWRLLSGEPADAVSVPADGGAKLADRQQSAGLEQQQMTLKDVAPTESLSDDTPSGPQLRRQHLAIEANLRRYLDQQIDELRRSLVEEREQGAGVWGGRGREVNAGGIAGPGGSPTSGPRRRWWRWVPPSRLDVYLALILVVLAWSLFQQVRERAGAEGRVKRLQARVKALEIVVARLQPAPVKSGTTNGGSTAQGASATPPAPAVASAPAHTPGEVAARWRTLKGDRAQLVKLCERAAVQEASVMETRQELHRFADQIQKGVPLRKEGQALDRLLFEDAALRLLPAEQKGQLRMDGNWNWINLTVEQTNALLQQLQLSQDHPWGRLQLQEAVIEAAETGPETGRGRQ
jgi:hypothetical protein